MKTHLRRLLASLAVLAALTTAASSASAQIVRTGTRYYGAPPTLQAPVQTNLPLYPGGPTLQQYSYNVATLGAAYSRVPPYALGYNPYPLVANYGPAINTLGYGNPGLYGGYGGYGYGAGLGAYGYPGSALASTPYGAGVADPSLATNPYYGNPYTPAYDPYGGALSGVADVTNANANGVLTLERARITSQKANQAEIDTRRKLFDELRYERMNTPTAEDLRIKDIEVAVRRARNDPPLTEILSGRSINDLINEIAKQQAKGLRGPDIRLDSDLLRHINLTNGTNGNVGLLRNGHKLSWPLPLQQFEELTQAINKDLETARKSIDEFKPVDPGTLKDLKIHLDRLTESLDNASARLTPSEYIEAKRYLNMLGDTYRALKDPEVAQFFNGGPWTAKGDKVAVFVDNLSRIQGLKVAPASPGDESYYRALHAALVNYEAGIASTTSR